MISCKHKRLVDWVRTRLASESGFTLIELLVVMQALAILKDVLIEVADRASR